MAVYPQEKSEKFEVAACHGGIPIGFQAPLPQEKMNCMGSLGVLQGASGLQNPPPEAQNEFQGGPCHPITRPIGTKLLGSLVDRKPGQISFPWVDVDLMFSPRVWKNSKISLWGNI